MQAIQSATYSAADLLGNAGELGSVKPGRFVDLTAVAADPLGDIRILETVSFGMKDGKIYQP